jgi:hypothetical protein
MPIDSFLNSKIYLLINNYFIPVICLFLNPPPNVEYILKNHKFIHNLCMKTSKHKRILGGERQLDSPHFLSWTNFEKS